MASTACSTDNYARQAQLQEGMGGLLPFHPRVPCHSFFETRHRQLFRCIMPSHQGANWQHKKNSWLKPAMLSCVPIRLAQDTLSKAHLPPTAVVVIALFATVHAFAVDVVDPLNKREPARPDYLPANPADPFALPPVERKPISPGSTDQESRYVQHIVFRGNTAVPTSELDAVAVPYRGRLVSVAEIEELRQALTRYYVERGYINSGALQEPEQRAVGARLRHAVQVKPGIDLLPAA